MSPRDKLQYSKIVPTWFDEIICGLILGDGNIRVHGNQALLSVQQTHEQLVERL